MYTDKDSFGKISVSDLSPEEAGLLQSAALQLADRTDNAEHARLLRRLAIQIDKLLPL